VIREPLSILQVNHGYPERYNAGSEVYTRHLSRALRRAGHQVAVFAREEDPYAPDYEVREESDGGLPVHLVNTARTQHRWQDDRVDAAFSAVLDRERPDAVHFHHLNHLSVGLPRIAKRAGCAVAFTVHDFWLACPRGQLVQWALGGEPWRLCEQQDDEVCATACYARCHGGEATRAPEDAAYWASWVAARMRAVEAALDHVDVFLCPSKVVAQALVRRFPATRERIREVDYGFPELPVVARALGSVPSFGYIGTHGAPKGVDLLVRAVRALDAEVRLRIWGRSRGQETEALRRLANGDPRIRFEGEYRNDRVAEVLAEVDAIVVPSIWLENSPLVIHEAQQAKVCVITADAGGMAEYVRHRENGLLFRHRDPHDLARQLRVIAEDRALAARLGARGYLHHPLGKVPSIAAQAADFVEMYRLLVAGVSRAA
jgi:glycosyltransferase involved in cell wall biosynthesis